MYEFYNISELTDAEIKKAFVQCFISRDGQIVLSFLKKMTQERCLSPDSSNEQLRHLEGQRYLFSYICSLCKQKK